MKVETKFELGEIVVVRCWIKDKIGGKSILGKAVVTNIHVYINPYNNIQNWYEKVVGDKLITVEYELEPINKNVFCTTKQYEISIDKLTLELDEEIENNFKSLGLS